MKHILAISIGDTGIDEVLSFLSQLAACREPPGEGEVDDTPLDDLVHWPRHLAGAKKRARVSWPSRCTADGFAQAIHVHPGVNPPRIYLQIPDAFDTLQDGIGWIESFPFYVCSIGTIFALQWAKMNIEPFGFGAGHADHGWACAFRGAGHDRLVSRRWLEFGPWRLIRRPGDLSIVQFHDIDVNPETAARQALPGHRRMGLSEIGGYLQLPYRFSSTVEGLYVAERRTLEIVVPPGGTVPQVSMRDACALRYMHRVTKPAEKPVDQVAFVFVDENDARAHLHELWLHELEVWLVDGDGKRRLDEQYAPTLEPPDWVCKLDEGA